MKHFILFLIVLSIISCDLQNQDKTNENVDIQHVVDSIKQVYAPDPRDHVWEITIEKQGEKYIINGATDLPAAKEALSKVLKKQNISFSEKITILPAEDFKSKTGVIRLSVANVRTGPEHPAELATQLFMGMPVEILEYKDGFYRIRTTSGYLGWTDRAAMQIMNKTEFEAWLTRPKVIVQSAYAQLLSEPKPGSRQVSDAVQNDVMVILQAGDFFHKVALPDGRTAYIQADKTVMLDEWHFINTKLFDINDLIQTAKTDYMGTPYLWGGTSVKASDCSGFTKSLFHNFGILLPRDASQQFRAGKEIPLDENLNALLPGDLLFFGKKNGDKPKITHVALYIGNGHIIHATGEVKEESLIPGDSLYNDNRRKTLLGAKRIFGYYDREVYPFYIKADTVKPEDI